MASEEESIEEAASSRKERLRALRAAKELLNGEGDHDRDSAEPEPSNENNGGMRFRNYVPQDKELQESRVAPPVLPKFEDPVAPPPIQEEKKQDPFLNIAPKKPNWDLRRDVQKKIDKLERRTQKAIYKLMEEQEKEKQLAENGAEAVED